MSLRLRALFAGAKVYWRVFQPITLGVKVMLIREEQILLVRHSYQPEWWYIPGGGVKRHESLTAAVRREAREELGATLRELAFWGTYSNIDRNGRSDHITLFCSEQFDWQPAAIESILEIAEARFHPLRQLPANITPAAQRRVTSYLQGDHIPELGKW